MTLIVPAERLMALLERVESAIEADQFVELRFGSASNARSCEPACDPPQEAHSLGTCGTPSEDMGGRESRPAAGILAPARPETGAVVAAASITPPPPPPSVRAPIVTPAPRAPWWRSEQAYRRRGVWLEWQRPTPWRRGLAAAAWLYLAGHLAWWIAR